MPLLDNKVGLITGAASGIGAVMARRSAHEGAPYAFWTSTAPRREATAAAIRDSGGIAQAAEADVRDAVQINNAVDASTSRFGRLDILVNNAAGRYPRGHRLKRGSAELFWKVKRVSGDYTKGNAC